MLFVLSVSLFVRPSIALVDCDQTVQQKLEIGSSSINQSINQFIDERIKTTTDIVIKINAN